MDEHNLWFTSDSHFYHANIIKYCNRPFTNAHEMSDVLVSNWNSCVGPEDTVWHLGDFAFCSLGQLKGLVSRLNGQINIILGNHDRVIIKNRDKLLSLGLFKSIQEYKEISYCGQGIVLFHYSLRVWHHSYRGNWCLWGHSHNTLPPYGKSVDVGVDSTQISTDYRPYSFGEIRDYMAKQEVLTAPTRRNAR